MKSNLGCEYGVQYQVFQGKDATIVTKERFFRTKEARDKFIDELVNKDNYRRILATSDPTI